MSKVTAAVFGFAFLISGAVAWGEEGEGVANRDFVTDHPGATDNPKTMSQGRYRIESDLFTIESEHGGDEPNARRLNFGRTFFVRGMSENSELQLGVDGFQSIKEGDEDSRNELGAITLRYKYNLVGNDSGTVAVAVIPKLVYTGALGGDQLTGGFNVPVQFSLPHDWSFAIMAQWDYVRTSSTVGANQFLFPAVLGCDFTEQFGAFAQYVATFDNAWNLKSEVGAGVSIHVLPKLQVDLEEDYGKSNSVTLTRFIAGVSYGF